MGFERVGGRLTICSDVVSSPSTEAMTARIGSVSSSCSKPIYMKVWEARKADGLDYDPEDERQQAFLSEITKYNIRSIE